jgi:hypothetical protein
MTRALEEAVTKQRKQDSIRARAPVKDIDNQSGKAYSETERQLLAVIGKIRGIKAELRGMQNHLKGNLNEEKITTCENQVSFLQLQLAQLRDEKASMQNLETEQNKALEAVQAAQNYPTRMKAITEETKKLSGRNREIKAAQKAEERRHIEVHKAAVDLEEKCRKLRAQIKAKKGLTLQDEDEPTIIGASAGDIAEIHQKIQSTEAQREEDERRLTAHIKQIEAQCRESQHNVSVMEIQLKEKDQEYRLSQLKIKELKRLTRHTKLKPLARNTNETQAKPPKQEEVRQSVRPKPAQPARKSAEYEDEEAVDFENKTMEAAEQSAKQIEDFEFRGPQRYR